ncbi:MAG: hypothetical protein M3067_15625 [Chloroflexota bacterium]|nr:hypothetical protein [Chloroflexota bacterium]
MADRDEGVRRVDPNEPQQPGTVRMYGWQWGPYDTRRPGLPWIGIFLVVLGALLLLQRLVPQYHLAGSAFALAIGLAFLLRWAISRGTGSLYAGAIITALALPDIIESLGVAAGPGLGTFCLGLAFLFIALVRWASRGSVGWQAWVGTILALYGLTRLAIPDLGGILVPAVLVALGVMLLVRGSARR